jgi:peptidoglycan/LPS O-acetylase OafA/YrhL
MSIKAPTARSSTDLANLASTPLLSVESIGSNSDASLVTRQPVPQKLFAHIPFLDGLRALSIFAVLTYHGAGPLGTVLFKSGGWVGVDAFFVISGFLISGILLKEKDKTSTIHTRNFYVRRALRLMPVFLLWIAVTSSLRILQHKFSLPAVAVTAFYLCDYDLALGWGNIIGSGFELAWSLSVEEKFYLIWPTVVKYFRQHLLPIGILAIVGDLAWKAYLLYQGVSWLRVCSAFDTKIDSLMIGCVTAILLNNARVKNWFEKNIRSSWISAGLLVFILFYIRGMGHPAGAATLIQKLLYWDVRLPIFTLAVAALIITLSATPTGITARILSFTPIAFIGRISYSLYLWHIAAFAFALWFGWQIHPMVPIEMELSQYFWAIVFAAVSFYFIETPFLKMKNRYTPTSTAFPSSLASSPTRQLVSSGRTKRL